jgi:hypothetical protein
LGSYVCFWLAGFLLERKALSTAAQVASFTNLFLWKNTVFLTLIHTRDTSFPMSVKNIYVISCCLNNLPQKFSFFFICALYIMISQNFLKIAFFLTQDLSKVVFSFRYAWQSL